MSETPASPTGTKQWHHSSDLEATSLRSGEEEATVLDMTPEEWPCQRQKDQEASGKTPERKLSGGLYQGLGDHQGSQARISSIPQRNVFPGVVIWSDVSFLGDGFFHWPSWHWCPQSPGKVDWPEGPLGHHQVAKSSPKDICFFWLVPSTESPKIMGLKWIHSPKALKWWAGLSFCPLCGNEGQNEGTMVNHLVPCTTT